MEELQYTILEEEKAQTFVANLVLDAALDQKYSQDDLNKLEFTLHDRRGIKQGLRNLFHIESKTGVLKTSKVIDRDSICSHSKECEIPLDILIEPGEFFQIIKVYVTIIDRNDNIPRFPVTNLRLPISETTLPGSKFALPSAEDKDSGSYGIKQYHLVSKTNKFGLVVTNGTYGTMDIHLVVKSALDRESADSFEVDIVAEDGGSPARSGRMRVDITVTDANDNNPQFDNYTYQVSIPENFPPGMAVLQLHARDPDAGANGQIFYRLSDSSLQSVGKMFGVDAHTGEIYLKSVLDYENEQAYVLTVTARDQGENSLPAYAKVFIQVEDINDHVPQITVNSLTQSGRVEVSEDSPIGTFVAHLSVTDLDVGKTGAIQCNMKSDQFQLTQLYKTEFKIITSAVLDREKQPNYKVKVVCQDDGIPSKTSTEYLIVTITDSNDNSPVFRQQVYSVSMRENNMAGAYITQVSMRENNIAGPG